MEKPVVVTKVLPSEVTVATRASVVMAVLSAPDAPVPVAPAVFVSVARAEVRGPRAAPEVLAEARAPEVKSE